jgi:hypothetical protein
MGRNDTQRAESDTSGKPVRIAVLAYPGAQRAAVHGLLDLFETASRLAAAAGVRLPGIVAYELVADDCRGRRGVGLSAVILPPRLSGTITPAHTEHRLVPSRCRARSQGRIGAASAGVMVPESRGGRITADSPTPRRPRQSSATSS